MNLYITSIVFAAILAAIEIAAAALAAYLTGLLGFVAGKPFGPTIAILICSGALNIFGPVLLAIVAPLLKAAWDVLKGGAE